MPQYIQTPLTGVELQRAFKLQGRVRPSLEEYIVPVIQVGELGAAFPPPVVRRAVAGFGQAAVVGQRPTFRFESIGGTIAVIRRLVIRVEGAAIGNTNNLNIFFAGSANSIAAQANVATKSFADGRLLVGALSGAEAPASVFTFGTAAVALATVHMQIPIPAEGLYYTLPGSGWVVGTGRSGISGFLELEVGATNITVVGSIEWDEHCEC